MGDYPVTAFSLSILEIIVMAIYWAASPDWRGETVFIVGGGTSVRQQNLELLRGRRVIAVNSSYEAVPFADYVFFGDSRWWKEHQSRPALQPFRGRLVTVAKAARGPGLKRMLRVRPPPGLATNPAHLASQRTSIQGAMNLAVHKIGALLPGAIGGKIVLLGADMCRDENGVSHHHAAHPWKNKPGNKTWEVQQTQLCLIVDHLKKLRVEVINTSPISLLTWWPKATLESTL